MADPIRCPDCGGIIGATGPSDQGPPCTCFGQPGFKSDANDPGGTQVMEPQKVCCNCGKDLTGKKRLKDSLGYWCPDCHKADQEKKKQKLEGVPCKKCMRIVKEDTLVAMDGRLICVRCAREERELKKPGSKKYRKVDSKQFQLQEKRGLMIMAGILVVLGILILLSKLGVIGK